MGEQLTQVHTQQIMQAAFAKGHEVAGIEAAGLSADCGK